MFLIFLLKWQLRLKNESFEVFENLPTNKAYFGAREQWVKVKRVFSTKIHRSYHFCDFPSKMTIKGLEMKVLKILGIQPSHIDESFEQDEIIMN